MSAIGERRGLRIPVSDAELLGDLFVPPNARGLVLFAHGSGSSRKSPRNRYVAEQLWARGLATLLFDLLTEDEERQDDRNGLLRFDIPLLAQRLSEATDWSCEQEAMPSELGYFGASTGAAAALIAAAQRPKEIRAVVSRGGRPDLAARELVRVKAPTLLIVGGADAEVLELNRKAQRQIAAPSQLAVVEGATHLFEESGALEAVAHLAGDWFLAHFQSTHELRHGAGAKVAFASGVGTPVRSTKP